MDNNDLSNSLKLSRFVHGFWRLLEWKLSNLQLLKLIEQDIELGIYSFDHADIYGNYECEKQFGAAIRTKPSLRSQIQIITKCGIKLKSDKIDSRKIKFYDYSYEHIVASAEQSLINLKTDYIDLLLLHRPSPFFDPEEVANAFSYLNKSGKVLNFGVSNFLPSQCDMLNSFVGSSLFTNQVEISPYNLEHFDNGNMDYFIKNKIRPMAWSPLAGGEIINPTTEKGFRIYNILKDIAKELDIEDLEQIAYSWLLKHPANIVPILGSGNIEHIKIAVKSLKINMSIEDWFRIYVASKGESLP